MIRRAIPVALLLLLGVAPGSALAKPPNRDVLRAEGVRVNWPATGTLSAGQRLTVKVESRRARVRLVLFRADAQGHVMRTLARRTLRKGTFSPVLPLHVGARYGLRLAVAGHRYTSFITTSCPPAGQSGVELRLSALQGRSGDTLTLSMANTGANCLMYGYGYRWERMQADGTWQDVPAPTIMAAPSIGLSLGPDSIETEPVLVWPGSPGQYRLSKAFNAFGVVTVATAPFEIVP